MVLLDFSMFPVDKGESLSEEVAEIIRVIDDSGLDYRLHSMGTTIEGDWDDVFEVVRKCFQKMKENSSRISASIKVDYREGKTGRIQGKVRKVKELLGKSVAD